MTVAVYAMQSSRSSKAAPPSSMKRSIDSSRSSRTGSPNGGLQRSSLASLGSRSAMLLP
jgi:hypothetical protein